MTILYAPFSLPKKVAHLLTPSRLLAPSSVRDTPPQDPDNRTTADCGQC